jgi:hypothetical protein
MCLWVSTLLYQARRVSSYVYMCVTLYQARGMSSHVYMCVGIKLEEWVVMYICVWDSLLCFGTGSHTYIHDYVLLWLGPGSHTHIHDYSPLWLDTHTHIYTTTHFMYMCVWVSTLYQARGVSSHLYICVGIKPEESVVMYICVWLCTKPEYRVDTHTHIYTWLLTPLAWYRIDTHTHIFITSHSSDLVQGR